MIPNSLASTGQLVNQSIRPTKVAIVHGSSFTDSDFSPVEIHDILTAIFPPLGVQIFSIREIGESGLKDFLCSNAYDVIGLVGEANEFSSLKAGFRANSADEDGSILLSFTAKTRFSDSKKYLEFSDALILCEAEGRNWPLEVFRIAFRLFESLLVPSLLNIDLADVKRVAKRIGFAFSLSEDDHEKIIELLPKDCFVARSAILHFSCKDDVLLREIYSISKSIALKKGLANSNQQLSSHSDARKIIRRVNVKMGIRIIGDNPIEDYEKSTDNIPMFYHDERRISMTAILFGI